MDNTTKETFVISPNGRFRRSICSWIRGKLLGSGSFGTVYEAINWDGFFFAVKEVSLDQGKDPNQCILQLEKELAFLSRFEHENIVQYVGTKKEETKLYIFLELASQGSLASLYQKYHLQDSQVVNPKGSYGPRADIWSLGCTVLEMLTRQVPYPNLEPAQAVLKIGRGEKPPIPETLSNDARDFIQKCVQVNPDDRPTASELLERPFIRRPLSASTSPDVSLRNGRGQSD